MLNLGAPTGNLRHGKKTNWPDDCTADDVRAEIGVLRAMVTELARTTSEVVVRRLAWELAQFTLREAAARRTAGELEFHDLLVLARSMLRDPEHGWEVRQRLRARYTHLLLDEFQDTDPIQCDLAALLASSEPDARAYRWDELPVDPGRLFVVGDPKQSIYRFRRADIAAFLRARSAFGASPRHLTRNFRSARPVIDFVNHVFRELIVAEPESQPEYVALEPRAGDRPAATAPVTSRCSAPSPTSAPPPPTTCASSRPPTSPRSCGALRRGVAGRWCDTTPKSPVWTASARNRVAWATSASCCRPARRSATSRTRSTRPASRTGPRRRRSSTARARSATCSWCSKPSTTRPTSWRW